jgi:hypothetical protein
VPFRNRWILTGTSEAHEEKPSSTVTRPLAIKCLRRFSVIVRGWTTTTVTVKFVELVAVPLGVVTRIGPVVALMGTVTVIFVPVPFTLKPGAFTLLNETAVAPVKLVPLIVTDVPTGPLVGLNELIVGTAPVAVKFVELVAVPLGVVTRIGPVVAPVGTETVILVPAPFMVKPGAFTLLNETAVAPEKLVPLIVTDVPTGPLVGLNDVIVGAPAPVTVKFVEPVAVPSGLVTAIGPVVAPAGTVAVILCGLSIVNVADVLLKVTIVTSGLSKLWPWIVTEVPTGPLDGLNDESDGVAARATSAPENTIASPVKAVTRQTRATCPRILDMTPPSQSGRAFERGV